MRISDWSSDVCSSDLRHFVEQATERPHAELPFEADPDIDGNAHHREHQADRAGPQQFFRNLARNRLDLPGMRGRKGLTNPVDELLAGSLGRRLVAFGQRGAERHRLVRPELLNRRSEEHTSELQSLMRISYAVFCLK